MHDFKLDVYIAARRSLIDAELQRLMPVTCSEASRLMDAMLYALMAGGKRLRPILCLAAAEAVGGSSNDALRAACALEMIHTYSLIHDDLPAMDNDNLRRGQPTCHVAFDEATAILAGDGLLTLAFQILASTELDPDRSASLWLSVLQRIAAASGCQGMIAGQMRDMAAEGVRLDLEDLKKMHALKTGALIEAAVYVGALLGGGTTQQIEQLEIYAQNVGLAFQIADDILNIEGDPVLMGKDVGTDQIRHKNTYPALMGLEASKALARELVNNALQVIEFFDNQSDPLRAIAHYIIARRR